jgi:hypothetical protein
LTRRCCYCAQDYAEEGDATKAVDKMDGFERSTCRLLTAWDWGLTLLRCERDRRDFQGCRLRVEISRSSSSRPGDATMYGLDRLLAGR